MARCIALRAAATSSCAFGSITHDSPSCKCCRRSFDVKVVPVCMQGTTTNGDYLLPFRTGAFLAGVPLQPVLLQYGKVGRG